MTTVLRQFTGLEGWAPYARMRECVRWLGKTERGMEAHPAGELTGPVWAAIKPSWRMSTAPIARPTDPHSNIPAPGEPGESAKEYLVQIVRTGTRAPLAHERAHPPSHSTNGNHSSGRCATLCSARQWLHVIRLGRARPRARVEGKTLGLTYRIEGCIVRRN